MSTLKIVDAKGAVVGDYEVADRFLVTDRGEQAVHDVVVALRSRIRAGTASTLRKGEVAGSNRKLWRQKGTGRARTGLRQSPIWRGGGVAFGPHPRDYAKKINRKVGQLAFRRALSDRITGGGVVVVDGFPVEPAKTKAFAAFLKALGVKAPVLVVDGTVDAKLVLASRNLARVEVEAAGNVNVYQLVRYPSLVVSRTGMDVLSARLKKGVESEA